MRQCRIETIVMYMGVIISSSSVASAQTRPVLHMGDQIRMQSADASGKFIIVGEQSDALMLQDEDGFLISGIRIDDITNLQLAASRSPGKGARIGASIGFFSGVAIGAIAGIVEGGDAPCSELSFCLSTQGKATVYAVVFGVLGAMIGGIFGTSYPGTEWHDIDISNGFDVIMNNNNEHLLLFSIRR